MRVRGKLNHTPSFISTFLPNKPLSYTTCFFFFFFFLDVHRFPYEHSPVAKSSAKQVNSNYTSVSAVRRVEHWSLSTQRLMRFKLGQRCTMTAIVRAIAPAFNPNTRGVARFYGRL